MARRHSPHLKQNEFYNVVDIPLDLITTDNNQPRYEFDTNSINELKDSIEKNGLLNPIIVEKMPSGNYKIIVGERRFRAFRKLRRDTIPCIVDTLENNKSRFAKQLSENIQRKDLNPVERGRALLRYKSILGDGATWKAVEDELSISETRRKQLVRLLDLPEEIQRSIVNYSKTKLKSQITEAHARVLYKLREYPLLQKELFNKITADDAEYTAAETEAEAQLLLSKQSEERIYKYSIQYSSKTELRDKLSKIIYDIDNGTRSKLKSTSDTLIDWTDKTWNPTSGCTQIADGCTNCYAKEISLRNQSRGFKAFKEGFKFRLQKDHLPIPFHWKTPQMIFVNSMSDLFHEEIDFDYIDKVMEVIRNTPYHLYQILTKRSDIMMNYCNNNNIPDNAWMGVTVENRRHGLPRFEHLKQTNAKIKFISAEPLLEDLGQLDLDGIDWVIVGGESGKNAREISEDWVINIKSQCEEQNVPFFFKQWGESEQALHLFEVHNGNRIHGEIHHNYPIALKESIVI